jgi:hypothetical protein
MVDFEHIDRAIKLVWKEDILKDYNNDFIFKEDSLKNTIYYHLRIRLGDGFMIRNRVRIYTEYYLKKNQRADIAIVQLKAKNQMEPKDYYLKDRVEQVIAVIELKHKNGSCGIDSFLEDIEKVKYYIGLRSYNKCQFYLGFIHETEYSIEEASWLNGRQQGSWANGRLTELSAFIEEESESGKMDMKIISYNKMNPDLNLKV